MNPYYTSPTGSQCGNGLTPAGKAITDTDITRNNVRNSPAFEAAWVRYLVKKFGNAAHGGVAVYQMDNEPSGWGNTHRDVHPAPTGWDELVGLTESYAAAVKAADSDGRHRRTGRLRLGGIRGRRCAGRQPCEPRRQDLGGAVLPPADGQVPETARRPAARLLRRALLPDDAERPRRLHRPVPGGRRERAGGPLAGDPVPLGFRPTSRTTGSGSGTAPPI